MAKLTPFAGAILVVGVLWSGAGHAAGDDLAALKAELEALKKDYNAHIQALEARIKQLESAASTAAAAPATAAPAAAAAAAAPAPAFPEPAPVAAAAPNKGSNADRLQPGHLDDPHRQLREPVAGSRHLPHRRLHAAAARAKGPGERSFNLGESELTVAANVDPYFFANVTAAIQRRQQHRHRGGLLQDAGPQSRLHPQGRPLLLRHRLPERDPLAQLGLRRSAAGVPGVLRRPARAGRRAAALARAHRLLHRARRRGRQRPQLPGHAAQFQRARQRRAVRARGRRRR